MNGSPRPVCMYILFSNILTCIYWRTHVGRILALFLRDNLVPFFNYKNFKRFGNSNKTGILNAINNSAVFLIVAKQRRNTVVFTFSKTIACY